MSHIKKSLAFLLVTISVGVSAQALTTYTARSENGICPPRPTSKEIFTVNVTNQVVSRQSFGLELEYEGKSTIFDNCKIADYKNWSCGGETMSIDRGVIVVFGRHIASNGKLAYEEIHHLVGGLRKRELGFAKVCFYEKRLLTYKLIG